jgi:PKD repeat protein
MYTMLKQLSAFRKLIVGLIGFTAVSSMSLAQMRTPLEEPYIPGHLIIQIEKGIKIEDIIRHLPHNYEFQLNRLLSDHMNAYLIEFNPSTIGQMDALNLVNRQKGVTIVQNNHLVQVRSTIPNDPQFGQQWHHRNTGQTSGTVDADIDTDEAWDITTGGQNALGHDIVVCILEQVDFSHNDLINNRWTNPFEIPGNGIDDDGNGYVDDIHGWNVASGGSGTLPTNNSGHGTNVAGMIGAQGNNSLGVVGANWNVKMMNVVGYNINSEASVVSAYNYPLTLRKAYNNSNGTAGAFVVSTNASWGIDGANPNNYPIWCAFYDTLGKYGILNCGATTNSNLNVDTAGDMPTACPSQYMVGIGRTDHNDNFAGGYGLNTINFPAPGINVRTTANGNTYTTTTGTSFSSPLTAGVIALLYSIPCPNFMNIVLSDPQLGADLVFNSLMDGVDLKPNLTNFFVAGGRLNVKNSMDLLMDEVCSACVPPSNISVSTINNNDATITFGANPEADDYTIYIQVAGSNNWTSFTTSNTSYVFTGLLTCTDYEFYIESNCDQEVSTPSPIFTFNTTGCGNCIELPYCATNATNPSVIVNVHSPSNVETTYTNYTLTDNWGGSLTAGYSYGNMVLVNDGSAAPSEGCGPLINGAAINGNIAIAVRGTCNFSTKALNAQNAGATALIIINNQASSPTVLGAGADAGQVTIPVIMISQTDGANLLAHLQGGGSAVGFMGQQSEWIQSFEFNGDLTVSGNDNGYRPAGTTSFSVVQGQSVPFTVTPGQAGQPMQQYVRIWVDANQDGVFDVSEMVYDQGTASLGTVSGSIVIPPAALTGSTRMRVQMAYQGYGSGALPGVCGSFVSGEVEDYCLTIGSGQACGIVATPSVTGPSCAAVQNGSIDLAVTGGTPGYTYSWNNGAGNVSSVSGLGAATYIVTITDAAGCDTSLSFTLNYTTNITFNSSVTHPTCAPNENGEILASATGGPGITYQWTGGPAGASYSNLGVGTYQVIATTNEGCSSSASYTLAYTTNLVMNANLTHPSCLDSENGAITVSAAGGSGITYQWTGGPSNATWSGLANGTYEVIATAANGCSITGSYTLSANPTNPVAGFNLNQTGGSVSFFNTSQNGTAYSWDFGDGNSSASFNPTHTYAQDGTYNVCLTVIGTCENAVTCQEVIVNTVGLETIDHAEVITVYPNPASNEINFKITLTNASEILLLDATGKIVKKSGIKTEHTVIDVNDLVTGIYFYQIYDNKGNRIYVDKINVVR